MPETSTLATVPRKKLPAKPYSGNEPLFDKDGFVEARIITIKPFVQNEGTPQEWQAYQWLLESEGTLRPWHWSELTVKRIVPPNKKGEVNRLTALLVKLGMITLDNLQPADVPLDALASALGRVVRFRVSRKDGYYRVDFATLVVAPG